MVNTLKTTILLALLTALFLVVGDAIGGESGLVVAFFFAVLMNASAYWFSGDIALRMAGAQQVTREQAPQLYQIVEEVATFAHLPMPRVAIVNSPSPNAFATGRDPQHAVVAVTTGIMGILNREELEGVLSHEMGHVRNHDILISSIAATVAGAITMLAQMAQWALIFGGLGGRGGFGGRSRDDESGLGALLMILVAPLAATVIQLALSRSREYQADATGAAIYGDPEPLARALEKLDAATKIRPMKVNPAAASLFIVNPLKGAAMGQLFSTHPPIQERVRRLRSMEVGGGR